MNDSQSRILMKIKESSCNTLDDVKPRRPVEYSTLIFICRQFIIYTSKFMYLVVFYYIIFGFRKIIPNINMSRLLFGMYSYTNIFSVPLMQQPNSLTRFRCCSLEMVMTSFLNSLSPCVEVFDNLFTAISCPFSITP